MDVQKAKLEGMREEFDAILAQLPKSMQENIKDAMTRGESYSYMFFMAGYILANKKKEDNADKHECRELQHGRSAL